MALNKDGVISEKIDIHKVPGAFELPGKIKLLSKKDSSSETSFEFVYSFLGSKILLVFKSNKWQEPWKNINHQYKEKYISHCP